MTNKSSKSRLVTGLKVFAWGLILLQGFHVFEHNLQTVQKFAWNDPTPKGLLGDFVDFEWLHFGANAGLWFLLIVPMVAYAMLPQFWDRRVTPGWMSGLFISATMIQTYHFLEHVIRMQVWMSTGSIDPRGILGNRTDIVILHETLNTVVYLMALPLAIHTVRSKLNLPPAGTGGMPASTSERARAPAGKQTEQSA
ncbi:MAG: hypothetical protein ACPGQL_11310 [Thermoplasmatota archaeon]